MTTNKKFFIKFLMGSIFIITFGIILFLRLDKKLSDLNQIKGEVTFYSQNLPGLTNHKDNKHRFLRLDQNQFAFEFYIGKDFGDFKPKFEKLDIIAIGDSVTVYFEDKLPFQDGQKAILNKDAQYVYLDGEPIFIRGNKDKYGAYFFLITGMLLLSISGYLKYAKIIE